MQDCETENKKNEEGVSIENLSTEENMHEQSSRKFTRNDNFTITKLTEISILKQLEEKQRIIRKMQNIYPEIEFEEIDMKTLKEDLKNAKTSMHTFKEIIWGRNGIKMCREEQKMTTVSKENISLKLVKEEIKRQEELLQEDMTNLYENISIEEEKDVNGKPYKNTFEEYLNMELEHACSNLFKQQARAIKIIEKKSKDVNDKINFLSQKQEYLQVKFNDIKKDECNGHIYGNFLKKTIKQNPQLRNEVYVSYKIQCEEKKEARKIINKIIEENPPQQPFLVTSQDIIDKSLQCPKKYTMQDLEIQKEIDVSYQRQCDINLKAVKALMKIEYENLLLKMTTESYQEGMSVKDINEQFRSKCKKHFEINEIPGPFSFERESDHKKEIVFELGNKVDNLCLRYDLLLDRTKHTQDVVKEMRKYKKTTWKKYTMNDPAECTKIKISYEKQYREREEANCFLNNLLQEIKSSEREKKRCEMKTKEAINIQNSMYEIPVCTITEPCQLHLEKDIHGLNKCLLYSTNPEENVKNPRMVKYILQKNKLQETYAAILTKNLKSLYENMLYKRMICGYNDKYTKELANIIEENVFEYKNRHKIYIQYLKYILKRLLKIEVKMNKNQINLEKLEKKIENLEKTILFPDFNFGLEILSDI